MTDPEAQGGMFDRNVQDKKLNDALEVLQEAKEQTEEARASRLAAQRPFNEEIRAVEKDLDVTTAKATVAERMEALIKKHDLQGGDRIRVGRFAIGVELYETMEQVVQGEALRPTAFEVVEDASDEDAAKD